jgi:hypothetical protein
LGNNRVQYKRKSGRCKFFATRTGPGLRRNLYADAAF